MRLILTILLLTSFVVYGQERQEEKCLPEIDSLTNEKVYRITDVPANVNGGMNEIFKEAAKRIKYPKNFERYSIENKVFVAFIVAEDGSITGQRIIKNISGTDIAEQLLKIVTEFKWQPGICDKKPVKSILILPMIIDIK